MKKIFWFAAMALTVIFSLNCPRDAEAQSYPFGVNWFTTDTTLHNNAWQKFCDDTLGFNTQHSAGANNSLASLSAWSKKSSDKIIASANTAIDYFSAAERMKYECTPKPGTVDLTHTYFINPNTAVGEYNITKNEWQIDSSGTHTDVHALDSNEILNGNAEYNVMWNEMNTVPFRVAVKLHVTSLSTTNNDSLLTIWVYQHRWGWSAHYGTTLDSDTVAFKFAIRWDSIKTANQDTVLFSPWFYFPYQLQSRYDTMWNAITNVDLSVHSKRFVTTRLAWVTIEDIYADSLLAGAPLTAGGLDPNRPDLIHNDTTVRNEIRAAENMIRDTIKSGKLLYYYLSDEAQVSEFAAQARVNAIIGDSGETERSLYQERRYAAMLNAAGAPPHTFRCGNFGTNPYERGGAVYADSGTGWGTVVCSSATDTLRKYGAETYGYFPVRNGKYVPDSLCAYDSTYTLVEGNNTCGTGSTDSSFDFYDFSRKSIHVEQTPLVNLQENPFVNAAACDSLVYLDTTTGHPKEWYANVFMDGAIAPDSVWLDTLVTHVISGKDTLVDSSIWRVNPNKGGWYYTGCGSTPEQMSMVSNLAICMGAHGLLYWWATSYYTGGHIETGFTSRLGSSASDYDVIAGDTLPTMYYRLCKWASKYSAWLKNYGSQLYQNGKYLGGYIRTYVNTSDTLGDDSLRSFTETIGTNPITDPTGDSSTRYMLNKAKVGNWPGKSFRLVKSGDSLVKEVKMPQALCWETQGYFQDTTQKDAARPNYFLAICNNFLDCRDLLCRFQPYGSSFVSRGEREIVTRMHMDSTVSKYYTLTVLDSTNDSVTVAYNGSFKWHYFPGEMHVFSIHPAYNFHIAQGSIDFNNGRRAEWDSTQKIFHVTYYRNDSVLYKQSLDSTGASWSAEYCITAPASSIFHCAHPSLRLLQPNPSGTYAVAITYQIKDTSSYYVYIRVNQTGDLTSWDTPIKLAQYPISKNVYEPTPVLAPFIVSSSYANSNGFVVAWAQKPGIFLRAVNLGYTLSGFASVNALHNIGFPANITDTVSGFPTIMEDSTGAGGFGLAFQQQSPGSAQIFFTTGTVSITPAVSVGGTPVWMSRAYGPDCDAEHPCLDRSRAMDITTPNTAQLGGGGGIQPWTAFVPIGGSGGIHANQRFIWNIAYDAPITITQQTWIGDAYHGYYQTTLVQQNAIWQVMYPMNGTVSWTFNLFQPPMYHPDNYYYPTVRAFDGDSVANLPSVIGWWKDTSQIVLFANAQNAYPQAGSTPDYIIHPLEEANITETALLAPPPTTTPNLEMNSHANARYANQRCVYKDTRQPDIRMLGDGVAGMDTAGSWYWQSVVSYEMKDTTAVGTCKQYVLLGYDPHDVIMVDTLPPIGVRTQFITLNPHTDSLAWKNGVFAITDTIHVGLLDNSMLFRRAAYTPDTAGFASSIGSGELRYYIEAASYATGHTLKTIDSLIVKVGNLGVHLDSITANMSALTDSVIFFRIRVIDTTTPKLQGIAATAYTALDTLGRTSGLAKSIGGDSVYMGRAGMVPINSNPILLEAYPNPLRSVATVDFTVPDIDDAQNTTEVIVMDMTAHVVATLAKDQLTLGRHSVTFNAASLPSGSYVVAVHTQNHMQSKLMILEK
jgi:hypothetical protein